MDYFEIGQRIRVCRKAKRLSQAQLAELVNISVPHMSHIETGGTKLSLPVLAALSTVLEASADYLLFGTASGTQAAAEAARLLADCPDWEAQILRDIMTGAKAALERNPPPGDGLEPENPRRN